MPDGVRDRPAEVWEALLSIADAAGGSWPDRAREACKYCVLDTEPEALSLGARLLRDIREIVADRQGMFSSELVAALIAPKGDGEGSDWADMWGKALDQRRLAKELKRYGVAPREFRNSGGQKGRGYRIDGPDGLAQAWDRYLPPSERDIRDKRDTAGQSVADAAKVRDNRDTSATTETHPDLERPESVAAVADVAHIDGRDCVICRCGPMTLAEDIRAKAHAACADQ
jgi:hypothetical protein